LVSPEQQRGFWQTLFQSKVQNDFATHFEPDYLRPFAQQQSLSDEQLPAFRHTAVEQCNALAKHTLFQADHVPFTEAELASFVTETGAFAITDLVLEQVPMSLDKQVVAFLQSQELLGNAILFFLHEQLRKDARFEKTLAALQREGLLVEVREIKSIVQTTEDQLNQAVKAKQFSEVAQLGHTLERLQQIESVTQTHYAQFLEFSHRFANWAALVKVQIEQVLSAMGQLQWQLAAVHDDVKQTKRVAEDILAIVQQLMKRADLSPQVKPRDEFTRHSSASLKLIEQARRLFKSLPPTNSQFSRVAIELGSVVSSAGLMDKAEALFAQAYQQAQNDEERALSAFDLFQMRLRRKAYTEALESLQAAIALNP